MLLVHVGRHLSRGVMPVPRLTAGPLTAKNRSLHMISSRLSCLTRQWM